MDMDDKQQALAMAGWVVKETSGQFHDDSIFIHVNVEKTGRCGSVHCRKVISIAEIKATKLFNLFADVRNGIYEDVYRQAIAADKES